MNNENGHKLPLVNKNFIRLHVASETKSKSVLALIDTGAVCSLISEDLANKLNLEIDCNKTRETLLSVQNKPLRVIGQATATVSIEGIDLIMQFSVVSGIINSMLIGCEYLRLYGAIVDC